MNRNFSSKTPVAMAGRKSVRNHVGRRVDWFFPDIPHRSNAAPIHHGIVICPECHAIYADKHLQYDEEHFRELKERPDVISALCDGCLRVKREMFQGHLRLCSPFILTHTDELLQRIRHEEQRARSENPVARIGLIKAEGDVIEVWTTTSWLAKRIGSEIEKAYHGVLKVQKLPRIPFMRVVWYRED